MILTKAMLTKASKKGRLTAQLLLINLSEVGNVPRPHFIHETNAGLKYPVHYCRVRFRVPQFIKDVIMAGGESQADVRDVVIGAGRCRTKKFAQSLAALEAVHRLEEAMGANRGGLQSRIDEFRQQQLEKKKALEAIPVDEQISGVSWQNLPTDMSFSETCPAGREGRIRFFPALLDSREAFTAAKAITLASEDGLPKVVIHGTHTEDGDIKRFANIWVRGGRIDGWTGWTRDMERNMDNQESEIASLENIYRNISRKKKGAKFGNAIAEACSNQSSSFGMAKLFVDLPRHQFDELRHLVQKVDDRQTKTSKSDDTRRSDQSSRRRTELVHDNDLASLSPRVASFRAHQSTNPLPVDDVESKIPHEATVTIVRGGTGSGKTTRYPLMLSLFSPTGSQTRVLVAQPRRLACQTAARRVAFEQGFEIGSEGCPIGYAVRFESFFSQTGSRTVDFATPGVLLRRATDDPLLQDVTHLCIDEVHERNADMDLLLALAKQAQQRRANHETLPPLRLVIMSATLDSAHWESYFADTTGQDIRVVDVPGVRRFPSDTVHLGEKDFPMGLHPVKELMANKRQGDDFDGSICKAMAALAVQLFESLGDGSILCFLPGMEEIRLVDRYIQDHPGSARQRPTVRYLHSSVPSQEQAMVFESGAKIILSTNIAETSVTIPDVKIVIDSGRERQFSLLDASSASDTVTVVGSQLVTVNISQASAKQRAGRAGRVSAGTCYRLFTRTEFERSFAPFTEPEMLRMDLSQLVLHALSLYQPTVEKGHPLSLLLGAPDPPTVPRLRQALHGLAQQGLLDLDDPDVDRLDGFQDSREKMVEGVTVALTPLGQAVSTIPATPRISRLLFVGLVLRAIEPALTIAALLSVPKVFSPPQGSEPLLSVFDEATGCSDIVHLANAYHNYIAADNQRRGYDPQSKVFEQVRRVRDQLDRAVQGYLEHRKAHGDERWNTNATRVAAHAGLIVGATPYIAHLVNGRSEFSTRDVVGQAKIHPLSVNFWNERRTHWYVYHELRTTKRPFLHVTTAASPLELALFSDASEPDESYQLGPDVLFVADQWVPVALSRRGQTATFLRLRRLLMFDMLQQVAENPWEVLNDPEYSTIVLYVLSAIEQQRVNK